MWNIKFLLLVTTFVASIYSSYGCSMEGVESWLLPEMTTILDTHRGVFITRSTTNITGINEVLAGEGMNGGPYVTATHTNSIFELTTNNNYPRYEENEVALSMTVTINFNCADGSNSNLVVIIDITDTNNNAPQFIPTDVYEFTVATPLPPGFQVTGCLNDIIVRDIDLTTQRIDFTIEDNPYFEIAYDAASSDVPKEFKAMLRTTTLIRTLTEVVELQITATDVDLTGDPQLTTTAIIRIQGDSDFQLPEEPIFSQPFYLATYTEAHQVSLHAPISLEQGFHQEVRFNLEGEYLDNFALVTNGNSLTLEVTSPLPSDTFRAGQIVLVVRAMREYTSGATATIIVSLPEVAELEFEETSYEGMIVDNLLQLAPLVLSQGYEDSVNVTILNEYSSFFTATVQGNTITLSMTPLNASIIDENNFISLQVVVTTQFSRATAVVTLDIIKDDNTTPAFERAVYTGSYEIGNGLSLEQIVLIQGYDDTVTFSLGGEHMSYFQLSREGPVLQLTSTALPFEILSEQHLLLTVQASKPRAVTANTAISITLPEARELSFQAPTYTGTLQDTALSLETIVLNLGYAADVNFTLSGDNANSFNVSNIQNQVTIILFTPLAEAVISDVSFLILTLTASGQHALTTSTTIILEIIKQDVTTPVFSQHIYPATFIDDYSIDVESISLIQGFDNTVTFQLYGEFAQYFVISNASNNDMVISLRTPIPEEIIFNEKLLVINVLANKPLTVGANAAIAIRFPQELTEPTLMRFSESTYVGSFEENVITLEALNLERGFINGTGLVLTGEYASHFTFSNINNIITLSKLDTLTAETLGDDRFILLEMEAYREMAINASTSIVIDIVHQEIIIPLFSEAFYRGLYTEDRGLQIGEVISLSQGYDESVTFKLDGEHATWFSVSQNGSSVILLINGTIPPDVIESNNQLLFSIIAYKPEAINGRAAISIELPKEIADTTVLRFSQSSYVGSINNGELQSPTVTLLGENPEALQLNIEGEFASFFEISRNLSIITILLGSELPSQVIEENSFFVLDIEASYPDAITGHTTVILEIIKETEVHIVIPVFEQAYYTGEYTEQDGLLFEYTIQLIQGFDESVEFTLVGDDAEWFRLVVNGPNNLTLNLIDGGMQQIEEKSHLIFTIIANKTDSNAGRAAIVISNKDFSTEKSMRFSQTYYRGAIENGNLTIGAMVLEEGYSEDVTFTFSGDYDEYFQLSKQNGTLTLLQSSVELPSEITNSYRFLVFTLDAQFESARAYATVILELIRNEEAILTFGEAYYVGSYSETSGLVFESELSLIGEHDALVTFSLEGNNSQWFAVARFENSVSIVLNGTIPNDILSNNQHLVFVITAERPESRAARATIVISLLDERTILNFEKNSYLGIIIESNVTDIEPIKLREGYSENVTFRLIGDLASYFTVIWNTPNVTIELENNIPPDTIPENRVIVLELQANAQQSVSAFTTIVFKLQQEEVVQLVFSEAYYTGRYTETAELVFENSITLAEGYTEEVEFKLDGEAAEWFDLEKSGNSVSLILTSPIPLEVVLNHEQIIFVIRAKTPGSITRAAIVITLTNEHSNITVLGFERHNYLGTIVNNTSTLESIVLNEGYSNDVKFILNGEYSSYFAISQNGSTVTIAMETAIPEELILPENLIILLELQASAPEAVSAFTTIVFTVVQEDIENLIFEEIYYTGHYTAAELLVFETPIILVEGYSEDVDFELEGDGTQWLSLASSGNSVSLTLIVPIPLDVLASTQQIILVITAQKPGTTNARAAIVISLIHENDETLILGFERNNYLGMLNSEGIAIERISLTRGYTNDVEFKLIGEWSSYFNISSEGAIVDITLENAIPVDLLPSNRILLLELQATAQNALSANATLVFEVVQEDELTVELVFNEAYYIGQYTEAEGIVLQNSIILTGFDEYVNFTLAGDSSQWFAPVVTDNSVSLTISSPIPPEVIINNQHLIFTINAHRLGSAPATATIIISLTDEYTDAALGFERINYLGYIENDVATIDPIILNEGFSEAVTFTLHGEFENYFTITTEGAAVAIALRESLPQESVPINGIVILELRASAPQIISAYATIVFSIVQETTQPVVDRIVFSETYYTGTYSYTGGLLFENSMSLAEGYDETVLFVLEGDQSQWFEAVISGNSVSLTMTSSIPSDVLNNNQQLIFTISAQRNETTYARAVIVISLRNEINENLSLSFERTAYLGTIENETANLDPIILSEGFTDQVTFTLHGELENYFNIQSEEATVTITLRVGGIPEESVPVNGISMVELRASAPQVQSAFTIIVFEIRTSNETDSPTDDGTFDKVLYSGLIRDGEVQHETITLSGFTGTSIDLLGNYVDLFTAAFSDGVVTVRAVDSVTLSTNVTFVPLELRAGSASAVLILHVDHLENPPLVTVTFSSASYALRVEVSQAGLVGRVHATANTGERVTYSLLVDNAHLLQRLSINSEGELQLAAPANSGVYSFQVTATTVFTQVTATAPIHLTVDAITVCGNDNLVVPPLIILDRDEEEPHQSLVVLNGTEFGGCRYSLTNRWPVNQTWLYVDENGLHANAIDREHESIAFMALSQIQVELILECDSDAPTRAKRSISLNNETRLDSLGPYEYGNLKWTLTDTILYNSRRTMINLIVNDINDNYPIFTHKENEPIAVGYPVPELVERILPRALAKLHATDADIGLNAELLYWSSAEVLAVSSGTGYVHVIQNTQLVNDARLTVNVTDQNGQGLTSSIELVVKLIDINHIAVVTIRDAFLEDEDTILDEISSAVGYEVKVLNTAVVSENSDNLESESSEDNLRKKREVNTTSNKASLQLYIYGLIEREPVEVSQLTQDINNNVLTTVSIASTVSLQDHLDQICVMPGRDTGLFVATIVLSVLFFILIVAAAVWLFLRWREKQNYEKFSDSKSLASRNDSLGQAPKPESIPKPRLNIEELKRSERRLQELLDTPIEEVTVATSMSRRKELPTESKINISSPQVPLVIQSIDKLKDVDESEEEDEFGQRARSKRKSVVTFNENVEKIIHVEDNPDDTDMISEYEVYKL